MIPKISSMFEHVVNAGSIQRLWLDHEIRPRILKNLDDLRSNFPECSAIAVLKLASDPRSLQNLENLREESSVSTRSAAVEALVKSKLDAQPLTLLVESIPVVGPLELTRLLAAFEHCSDESVGLKLIAALKQSPVLTSLRVDSVKQRIAKFPPAVHAHAEELYAAINVEAGRQQE